MAPKTAKVKSSWNKTPAAASASAVDTGTNIRGVNVTAKKAASGALAAAGVGVSAAQKATSTPGMLALATGAAAASATGIGLVVVGALATVATSAKAIVAANSSRVHRNALEKVQERWREMPCDIPPECEGDVDMFGHQRIALYVLPYVIEQKNKKYHRKAIGAAPVIGGVETLRAGLRALTKKDRGQQRSEMAYELAAHLITHNCALAQAIVSELYSYEKMLWMLDQDSDVLVPLLMNKLAST